MESLESDNTTNKCFGMIESAEANNHVASDELEGIFDVNSIYFKEVNILPIMVLIIQNIKSVA